MRLIYKKAKNLKYRQKILIKNKYKILSIMKKLKRYSLQLKNLQKKKFEMIIYKPQGNKFLQEKCFL
jgi:hypothetical protein